MKASKDKFCTGDVEEVDGGLGPHITWKGTTLDDSHAVNGLGLKGAVSDQGRCQAVILDDSHRLKQFYKSSMS